VAARGTSASLPPDAAALHARLAEAAARASQAVAEASALQTALDEAVTTKLAGDAAAVLLRDQLEEAQADASAHASAASDARARAAAANAIAASRQTTLDEAVAAKLACDAAADLLRDQLAAAQAASATHASTTAEAQARASEANAKARALQSALDEACFMKLAGDTAADLLRDQLAAAQAASATHASTTTEAQARASEANAKAASLQSALDEACFMKLAGDTAAGRLRDQLAAAQAASATHASTTAEAQARAAEAIAAKAALQTALDEAVAAKAAAEVLLEVVERAYAVAQPRAVASAEAQARACEFADKAEALQTALDHAVAANLASDEAAATLRDELDALEARAANRSSEETNKRRALDAELLTANKRLKLVESNHDSLGKRFADVKALGVRKDALLADALNAADALKRAAEEQAAHFVRELAELRASTANVVADARAAKAQAARQMGEAAVAKADAERVVSNVFMLTNQALQPKATVQQAHELPPAFVPCAAPPGVNWPPALRWVERSFDACFSAQTRATMSVQMKAVIESVASRCVSVKLRAHTAITAAQRST
jgi:hypothetical protein